MLEWRLFLFDAKMAHFRHVVLLAFLVFGWIEVSAAAIGSEPSVEIFALGDDRDLVVQRHGDSFAPTLVLSHRDKELQSIAYDNSEFPPDIVVEDYNFAGHPDFSFFGSMGAATMFREVYLFDSEINRYTRSKVLSDLPCIEVDVENKLVIGTCFHHSACENWREAYAISGLDELVLTRKWGTRCGPASEAYYETYDSTFEDGRIKTEQWKRHTF